VAARSPRRSTSSSRRRPSSGNNAVDVDEEDNMFGVISYAFDAYLMQIPE